MKLQGFSERGKRLAGELVDNNLIQSVFKE